MRLQETGLQGISELPEVLLIILFDESVTG